MSKRIKTAQSLNRDYKQMLKEYFGRFLYGLDVTRDGCQVQAQVVYFDFKHIETVRRELSMMMPEVTFTKLKRDYTSAAESWALANMMSPDYTDAPVIYMQHGDTLVRCTLRDIARSELNQIEIDATDSIDYTRDNDILCCPSDDETLQEHSWD